MDVLVPWASAATCCRLQLAYGLSAVVCHGIVVSGIRRMNEVNPCRARLVHGWMTVFGWLYRLSL